MKQERKSLLILDYSTDGASGVQIGKWFPPAQRIEAVAADKPFPLLDFADFSGVIHSGSALSINDDHPFIEAAMAFIRDASAAGVPQMGICYGHQLLVRATVGRDAVGRAASIEMGWLPVRFLAEWPVSGMAGKRIVWQSHYDCVNTLPQGSVLIATNEHTRVQAFFNRERKLFGTQFHPEFDVEAGNRCYTHEKALFEKEGIDLQATLNNAPDINTGAMVLKQFSEIFNLC